MSEVRRKALLIVLTFRLFPFPRCVFPVQLLLPVH